MVNPTGYTALDLIGFTDKGPYSSGANYVKNDLVHYSSNVWRCLIDDTSGIVPAEGVNWTLFIGEPTNLVERIIAPVETDPATSAWTVGRQIIFNDNLYEVITAITAGDALIAYEDDPTNANIKLADPVETQVLAQKTQIQTLTNDITDIKKCNTILHGKTYGGGADGVKTWAELGKEAGDALLSIANNALYTGKNLIIDGVFLSGLGTFIFAESPIFLTGSLTGFAQQGEFATIETNELVIRTWYFGGTGNITFKKAVINSNGVTTSYEGATVPTTGNVNVMYHIDNNN